MTATLNRATASALVALTLIVAGLAQATLGAADAQAQDFHFRGGTTLQDFHRSGTGDFSWGMKAQDFHFTR